MLFYAFELTVSALGDGLVGEEENGDVVRACSEACSWSEVEELCTIEVLHACVFS